MSERCVTCGCELAYPTAIHLVDCPNPIEKKREEKRGMVIDHTAEARKILEAVEPYTNNDLGVAMNSAHIHATLALVEQQRIANLISLGSQEFGVHGATDDLTICRPIYRVEDNKLILDPGIRAGLRIEEEVAEEDPND